jgi:hypothetical protein
MTTATVGALKVVLSADSAQFSSGLKDAQGMAGAFGAALGKVAGTVAAFGAAAVAAAAAIAVGVKRAIDSADKLDEVAEKVGLSVTALSELQYAAKITGVSFEGLQTGVVRLTRAMSDVAKGGESDAAKAFQVLGIEVQNADGSLRSSADVLGDIAQKFSEFKDGAEKTALAVAIFGRSGADMIPLLNQGAEGLGKLNQEARDFGVAVGPEAAKASAKFNEDLDRLQSAFSGIYIAIAQRVVPILAELTEQFVILMREMKLAESAGQLAEKVLGGIAYYAALAKGNIEGLTASFAGWKQVLSSLGSLDFAQANKQFQDMVTNLDNIEKRMLGSLQRIRQQNMGLLSGADAILSADGFTGGSNNKRNAPTIASASATAGGGGTTPQQEYDYEKARIEARLVAIREGLLTEEETKYEAYQKDLMAVEEALNKKILLEQDAAALRLQIEKKFQDEKAKLDQESWNAQLSGYASFFGSMGKVAESWGKKNNAVSKALGIAQALISTYVGATKALASAPFPANMGAFAAVMAKGLAAVSAIMAVNPNGGGGRAAIGGGSFSGGAGAAQQQAPEQAGRSMYVTLSGDVFNREMVRGLLEKVSDFQKDGGGKVVFA